MAGEVKIRFRWNGEEGRIIGDDFRKLLETDWIIAADFLNDIIHLAQDCYDEVLKKKYAEKGANHGE
jgi:hypothetical protein